MVLRKTRADEVAEAVFSVIETTGMLFLRLQQDHPHHDPRTCFGEVMEQLRAAHAAEKTGTRRSSGD